MKIQIDTSLHWGALSLSLRSREKWLQLKETSAWQSRLELEEDHLQRCRLHTTQTVRVEPSPLVRLAPLCPWWPSEILSAVHSSNRDCPPASKAKSRVLPKGATSLTHHAILWWVLWSALLSLSSPTYHLGVVTGKRIFGKCSKPESQENPTDSQCVLFCIGTQSSWKKKYTANLGASYINSLKMPFEAHLKNEATNFLLQQFI